MRRPTWIVDTRRCTSCTDMKFDLHPSPKEPIGWKVRSLGAKLTLRSGAARQCQVLFRSRLEIVFTTGCFCTCSIGCLNFQGTSQSTALRNDWQPRTADSTLAQVSLTSTNRCPICITGERASPNHHQLTSPLRFESRHLTLYAVSIEPFFSPPLGSAKSRCFFHRSGSESATSTRIWRKIQSHVTRFE